jgi:hypothetical protein
MAPRIPLDPGLIDEYGVGNPKSLAPTLAARHAALRTALDARSHIDVITQELCRLRNAKAQQCRLCLRLRYTDADEALLSAVDDYATNERLTARQRLALELADSFLRAPGQLPIGRRNALVGEFAPDELVELVVRQLWFLANKAMVALGLDGVASRPAA